jgi:hypothetical protein
MGCTNSIEEVTVIDKKSLPLMPTEDDQAMVLESLGTEYEYLACIYNHLLTKIEKVTNSSVFCDLCCHKLESKPIWVCLECC